MNLEVDDDKKTEIAKVITSPDSPVGIDAKKTHIISILIIFNTVTKLIF